MAKNIIASHINQMSRKKRFEDYVYEIFQFITVIFKCLLCFHFFLRSLTRLNLIFKGGKIKFDNNEEQPLFKVSKPFGHLDGSMRTAQCVRDRSVLSRSTRGNNDK